MSIVNQTPGVGIGHFDANVWPGTECRTCYQCGEVLKCEKHWQIYRPPSGRDTIGLHAECALEVARILLQDAIQIQEDRRLDCKLHLFSGQKG
jgi:hypothetical protein